MGMLDSKLSRGLVLIKKVAYSSVGSGNADTTIDWLLSISA